MSKNADRQRRFRQRQREKRNAPVTPVTPVTASETALPVTPVTPVTQDVPETETEKLKRWHDEDLAILKNAGEEIDRLEQRIVELEGAAAQQGEIMQGLLALDAAVSPFREQIKQFGLSEAQTIDQLFKWQMALAGPDKIRAFRGLMQNYGADISEVAAPEIAAAIARVPPPPQPSPAYDQNALYTILEEQNAKLEEQNAKLERFEKRDRNERARRAGSSMRSTSPDAIANAQQANREEAWKPQRTDVARVSIQKALAELRGS